MCSGALKAGSDVVHYFLLKTISVKEYLLYNRKMSFDAQAALNIIDIAMPIIILVWIIAYVVLGFIIHYHWHRYGIDKGRSRRVIIIYFAVGALLILSMFASYIAFTMETKT